MFFNKMYFSFVIFSVMKIEDLHASVMKDPENLWEFEVVSRIDLDPGNYGKWKCIITTEEFKRHIAPPKNLGHSAATIQGILKLGKSKTTVNPVKDIIRKLGIADHNSSIVTSLFTLVPEGSSKFFFALCTLITVFSIISYFITVTLYFVLLN